MSALSSRLGTLGCATLLALSAANVPNVSAAGFAPSTATGHLTAVRTRHCNDCGTVVSINPVRQAAASGSGAGAIVGAIAGGVLGHQVGGGRGRDIATAGGAIAGGLAGNEVEKRARARTVYDVTVRMDSGGTETARVDRVSTLRSGSRVHIIGNNIRRM